MLTETELKHLIEVGVETSSIDYKAEPHRLDNDYFKSEFIKDILALANTPRDESAYIIIGVKLHKDGSRELLGVSSHHDDADLQSIIDRAKVEPKPSFIYQPFTLDDLSFGVIEIPVSKTGPFVAKKELHVVKADRIYFRRGTQNAEASSPDERRAVYQWFLNDQRIISTTNSIENISIPNWDEFARACHHFSKNRLYLLIIGPESGRSSLSWTSLAKLPVSLVLDFDSRTQVDGAYAQVHSVLRDFRSLHLWTLGNKSTLVPEKACYWYAARGLEDNPLSLVEESWQHWNRKYGEAIQDLLKLYARASGGRPLTVISLYYAPEYLRQICETVDRVFADAADYVFANSKAERLEELSTQFNGEFIQIPLESVLFGINENINIETIDRSLIVGVPKSDGTFANIDQQVLRWLSEDLEVLHSNIELEAIEVQGQRESDYLRGGTVTWGDLEYRVDAERDKTSEILRLVDRELNNRSNIRVNLYHWPGAGGTTVARRIAWELHRRFPVVVLHRVTYAETTNRFRELFRFTGQPILAIAEGADTTQDNLQQLYVELKSENIPVTFLNVIRRFQRPKYSERSIFLDQALSNREAYHFAESYKRVTPGRSPQLDMIVKKPMQERTPFQFALTAFGRDYIGVTRYVETRLATATERQKELLVYISLAYYYGHRAVFSQLFAVFLGRPENRSLRLDNNILSDPHLELLLEEKEGYWRPIHQIIAEEILAIILTGIGDRRSWKRNLTSWAIEFIKLCQASALVPSDEVIDLVRRIYILRNETEILGTESSDQPEFAALIRDVQTDEGRLSILRQLVESFPNEAHFWGHLGRFYSIAMHEPTQAIFALDRAIALSPDDPVLYHMKGMSYRNIVSQLISDLRATASLDEGKQAIQGPLENALNAFEAARERDADSEHAYISPVQMLLRVVDFGYVTSGADSRVAFLTRSTDTTKWYRELLDRAELYMEEVKRIREGDNPSRFIIDCQANLDRIYDDYERALQGWENLLARSDVYAPPIRRQIVRAYLARKNRKWDTLNAQEVSRIVELLEQNLREEPSTEHNMRLWFRALRYLPHTSIDVAIDRIANWRMVGDAPDAYYYLYVLHVVKAIEGSTIERQRSHDLIDQSRFRSRNVKNRTRSHEWLGKGEGIRRLVNSFELGEWDKETDFYSQAALLERVTGRVAEIRAPEAGYLEMASTGLKVFFVPAKANILKGRDENKLVSFFLGFSYEGLRAWSVESIG